MKSTNKLEVTSLPTWYTNNPDDIPEKLKNRPKWLTTLLDEYDLTDWCFYGYVGSGDDLVGIGILFQKKEGKYVAILGIYNPGVDSVWNLSVSYEVPLFVSGGTDTAPWSVTALDYLNVQGKKDELELGFCKVSLVSGAFGEANAEYKIEGKVHCEYDLTLDIEMIDRLGAFNTGYGPASFLPNYLLKDQALALDLEYNGNLEEYLEKENPPLTDQGSYYFSSAMEVTNFNITKKMNGETTNQDGNSGFIWFDSVTQNFGELNDMEVGGAVSWHWITIPRVSEGVSLSATKLVYTDDNILNLQEVASAALYSKTNLSGQRWNSNNILFQNQPAVNGQVREFTLRMIGESSLSDVSLTFKALPGSQVISAGATEGNYLVTGSIGAITLTEADEVYAWCELGKDTKKAPVFRMPGFRKAVEKLKELI